MADQTTIDQLTNETVELLQAMIRNQCVNDGTVESGGEDRNANLLRDELESTGVDIQMYEPEPGRKSLVARIEGTDPTAPSLCLMGHTDVVPVSPDGWREDPFGGDLIDGEVWGRGAVDMLNVTASMGAVFRHMARNNIRYPGDIVYFAVADEEAGGKYGAEQLVADEWDALQCDFVLTEYGGTPVSRGDDTIVLMTTAEKGLGARELTVHGEPGHGSMPWGTDNALVKAAEVVRRIKEYEPAARIDEMFAARVKAHAFPPELEKRLLDPNEQKAAFSELTPGLARNLHSCCHTSFSPNVITGGTKTNVIPDRVTLEVDIRVLPGETSADIEAHLRAALGDELMESVSVEPLYEGEASQSTTDTRLWTALEESVQMAYPGARIMPSMVTGGTDARFFRMRGVPSYGAGLLSPAVSMGEFMNRFHGHNERIDVESLRLTTELWLNVCDRLWAR